MDFHSTTTWILMVLVAAIFIAVVVGVAVEIAMSRRFREIKGLFREALEVSKSYDAQVKQLRTARDEDRKLLDNEVLPRLGKLEEEQINHGRLLEEHGRALSWLPPPREPQE